jgi:hypothetical protein
MKLVWPYVGLIPGALAMALHPRKTEAAPGWPTFFVVGAAKSGTTSLYHYLDQHPDVYMPRNKEPHYFSRVPPFPGRGSHPVTSEEEYLDLFKVWNKESVSGEASPSYLWDEKAPYRIKETVPQAKIIAILRHPVERAYSHYLMDARLGKQDLSFREALERDYSAENKGWGVSDQYIDLGLYAQQVQRYLEVFDRAQVKIFLYEDLRGNPGALLHSAFEFLGVDPNHAEAIRTDVQYNVYSVPRNRLAKRILRSRLFKSRLARNLRARAIANHQIRARLRQSVLLKQETKSAMDPCCRRFLMDLYRPDILRLQDLLNRDLGHWLQIEDEN